MPGHDAPLVDDGDVRKRWERLYQLLPAGGRKLAKLSYQAGADNALLLRQIIDGPPDADRSSQAQPGDRLHPS